MICKPKQMIQTPGVQIKVQIKVKFGTFKNHENDRLNDFKWNIVKSQKGSQISYNIKLI